MTLSVKSVRYIMLSAALLIAIAFPETLLKAQTIAHGDHVGTVYEIRRDVEKQKTEGDLSSGSSTDRDTLIERLIAQTADGVELEYDLPVNTTADERVSNWMFPVRIVKSAFGRSKLVNGAELEKRLDGWLKAGKMTRAACGHWVFTWNAFKIECDPEAAVEAVAAFDLRFPIVREGTTYSDRDAATPIILRKVDAGGGRSMYVGEAAINQERVRHQRVEAEFVTAEILRKPLIPAEASLAHADEVISGTIAITFDLDADGQTLGRKKVVHLTIAHPDQAAEKQEIVETVNRVLPGKS